jgi:hypothetical protein
VMALRKGHFLVYIHHGKVIPGGRYLNPVWGPVAVSFDPPLPRWEEDFDGSDSTQTSDVGAKSRAEFNLIQYLSTSIRTEITPRPMPGSGEMCELRAGLSRTIQTFL